MITRGDTLVKTQKLVAETCASCGVMFGLPEHLINKLRGNGSSFFCPNGHSLSFGKTDADKLREERNRLKQRLAQRDDQINLERRRTAQERRSAAAYKGQATKLKNKAKAGECPCCNKSYVYLKKHMENKHPDFDIREPKEEKSNGR